MLPSSTVENYLKAIYLGASSLAPPQRLVPMGQLSAALGVAPGTATTMVKALAESGLVQYEPYSGVALTPAGAKLAALVLRRHRLIELFLVQVMGYSWDEVHDEAEQLEHAVTDRLIDRIDEMLGRPEVDPHGDPIPDSDGLVKQQDAQSLLTCPMNTPVTVTRVIDQDKVFLRFIEHHQLKPGETIEVEERDSASDSVSVRGKNEQRITIGTRAASKLLVQVARGIVLLLALAGPALAQDAAPAGAARPFEITDNSFFVEEAFNQDVGIFQNIFNVRLFDEEGWTSTFTQEWPLFSHRHQISYTIAYLGHPDASGLGDSLIHYRFQVHDETAHAPAFSPRVSLILPSGSVADGLGTGGIGWEVNMPFSKQVGDFYLHWNAGFTHRPKGEVDGGPRFDLFTPRVAASGIWRARDMLNLMLESVVEWAELPTSTGTVRETVVTVVPGLRTGWNSGDAQTILGVGAPVAFSENRTKVSLFAYLSYELPFTRK